MDAVSSTWIPASLASMPWVVPLLSAIQSGKMPCAFSPLMRKSASSTVESPSLPLISPTSVSRPAHDGTYPASSMPERRFSSSRRCEASMAMEVIPASNREGISTCAASTSFAALDPVVVGVNRDRNGDPELVREGVHERRHIPEADRAVGAGASLRLGYFNDYRGVRPLGRLERAADHEGVARVGRDRHGLPFGYQRAVDGLAADEKGSRVAGRVSRRSGDGRFEAPSKSLFRIPLTREPSSWNS